ncbi:tRNA lysidine(34) synthetase TilS [Fodinisporobacter ferrooxydans]|uniref:tRNA(Ile)-lysidine synthase n=1 Tax=Fodinisporobacter ferrooxydans TaxID=2901836 RepID=A0ABY4CN15_9BACL|nr:tRNA lysidine(34) synthetase TilS [Alicyclobacillaceae bacterium MYW30-H2]
MFLQKLRQTIQNELKIETGAHILVGVSGGVDSVCLLVGLHSLAEEFSWQLTVCHVEHGLRGEESKEDADFVEQLAKRLNLPFVLGEFDVAAFAKKQGLSTQIAARIVRYDFFEKVMREKGADYLAVAHHADDQAETILMRILRGTSTSGMAGMHLKRKWRDFLIIRPLLWMWRHEIEEYCQMRQLSYRTDSSNVSTKYLRNKIRLELIPYIEHAYNPNIKERLLRLGKIVQNEDEYLERHARQWMQQHCQVEPSRILFSRTSFQKLDFALQPRAIKLILYYLSGHTTSWESIHIDTIYQRILDGQNVYDSVVAHGIYLRCEYDSVHFHTYVEPSARTPITIELNQTKSQTVPFGSFIVYSDIIKDSPQRSYKDLMGKWETVIPIDDAINHSKIRIRTRIAGDSMQPFGFDGTTKVKKLMIDRKIPASMRDQWPILEIDHTIVWIPGIRRSRHYLIHSDTKDLMHIRVSFAGSTVQLEGC